jgi:MobA/MobL family
MAIPYLNVQFPHVSSHSGACEVVAYLGRCEVPDVRLGRRFDYQHLNADLVHDEVIRCNGVPAVFENIEYLGNAIDEAEAYRVRGNRTRKQQIGAAIVLALPPDTEISLTEASEFTRRVALSIAGERRLAIYTAIHDPALTRSGAQNRHGHALFPRREIDGDEFSGPAIRDMFARPLNLAAGNPSVTVEGNRWPEFVLYRFLTYFAELGIDLAVDSIAPFPGKHWATDVNPDDPRVQNARQRLAKLNLNAIHGDPGWLIGKLLRGRSMIRIAELQQLCDKFIDNEGERRARLEAILGGPNIATFAADPVAAKPRFVTTKSVHDSIKRASELVDRAASEPDTRTIHAVTAASHMEAVARFGDRFGRSSMSEELLLLGNNHSQCAALSKAIKSAKPVVATIKAALSDPPTTAVPGPNKTLPLWKSPTVVVPRAESVNDQTLAQLVLKASERSATLILIHDQSRQAGIASHRLAAYAADRLAPMQKGEDKNRTTAVETLLRAGLIGTAVELMAQHQSIAFERVDARSDDSSRHDFVVLNDPRRLKDVNEQIRSLRLLQGKLDTPTELGHPHKPFWLSQSEWIVFTRTDYSVRPPRILAGELAQIMEIDRDRNTINVLLSDGAIEPIELKRFAHFRSAHALLVREARNVTQEFQLRIEVNEVHHIWAALLLAVQHPLSKLIVDPQVAIDVPSLIAATCRSLPAALPHQLTPRRDPDAEIGAVVRGGEPTSVLFNMSGLEFIPESATQLPSAIVSNNSFSGSPADTPRLESFPEPAPTAIVKSPSIVPMHERVRAVLDSNPHTRRGFERLCEKLSPDNRDRDADAEHILSLCRPDGPTATIVKLLTRPNSVTAPNSMAHLDLPLELDQLSPRSWDDWELYCLKMDLSTMQFDFANWNIAPAPSTPSFKSTKNG